MISAGFNLEEELLAVILLTTLPDTWTSVVQGLQDAPTITVNRVISAMLIEEYRRKIANTTFGAGGDKALYLNRPGRG